MLKVVEMSKNIERHRKKQIKNITAFIQNTKIPTFNTILNTTRANLKNNKEYDNEKKTMREKFKDKIHFDEKYSIDYSSLQSKFGKKSSFYFDDLLPPDLILQEKSKKKIYSNIASPYFFNDQTSSINKENGKKEKITQKMNDLESKKYNFINLSEGISMETTLCNVLTDEKLENFPKKYEKYMRKYKKNKEICIENNYFLPKLSQDKKKEKSSHTFSLSGRGYLA